MCNRRAMAWSKFSDLEYYYLAKYSEEVTGMSENNSDWLPFFNVSGYDHTKAPVVTSRDAKKLQMFSWGLIPYQTKSLKDALQIRNNTLLCRHEEMYDTYSYQQLARNGKRCLIPTSGYFEYQWLDPKGKNKIPYYIYLKNKPIFSLGGLYSKWTDPESGADYFTYTICTTVANDLVGKIHNTGQRMPVILSTKNDEARWLDTSIKQDEVLLMCRPISSSLMNAHPVARMLRSNDSNVPTAIAPCDYPELRNRFFSAA